jgi:DNA-binding transcriptional LysR family regulator
MDRLTSIAIFVAAVEEGSLVAAGRRHGLSASMAGKHLSALEDEMKVRLLQRSTRSLHLTDAGRAFHARAQRILEEFDEASREAGESGDPAQGLLRIAAPVSFGALHLGDVVAAYLDAHPGVHAEVLLDDRYIDLPAAGVDVAVRIGLLPDSGLVARRLAPCRMVLCAAPAYCQRAGTPAHPDDLRGAPLLVFGDAVSTGDWMLTDAAGQAHRIEGQRRLVSNNMQMLLSAALAGIGVAYGPSFVFGPLIASGELVALLPGWRTTELAIQAVYPSARYVPAKVRGFIDSAIAAFGEVPPWDRPAP